MRMKQNHDVRPKHECETNHSGARNSLVRNHRNRQRTVTAAFVFIGAAQDSGHAIAEMPPAVAAH